MLNPSVLENACHEIGITLTDEGLRHAEVVAAMASGRPSYEDLACELAAAGLDDDAEFVDEFGAWPDTSVTYV